MKESLTAGGTGQGASRSPSRVNENERPGAAGIPDTSPKARLSTGWQSSKAAGAPAAAAAALREQRRQYLCHARGGELSHHLSAHLYEH